MRENKSYNMFARLSFMPASINCCLVVMASFILLGGNAQATLLNLTMEGSPDVFSGYIDVTYNASSNTFVSSGWALTYYDGTTQIDFDEYTQDSFNISATIDEAGVASSGSLTITGQVAGYGSTGPLLTGNLTDFGFGFWDTLNPNSDVALFEFLFEISGGDLAGEYGGSGATVGVILGCVSTGGDVEENQFTADFDNLFGNGPGYGSAVSDTGTPIPEPGTLLLLGVGGLFLSKRKK